MKSIFRIILCTSIIGGIISCESQSTVQYANSLEGCLSPSEISLLNTLCQNFETHITNTYELSPTESYRQYIGNVAKGNFPQNFFKYQSFESDMNQFYNSTFYQSEWVKTSTFDKESIMEVPPTMVDGKILQQEMPDPIVLNPTGDYVKCLSSKNKVQAINDYLEIVKSGVDVSPGLVASAISENMTEQDLNSEMTRLIIAINFHYQIGLYVTGMN